MDPTAAEIVKDIAGERRRLGDNLTELERKMKQAADWRSYFARSPWAMIGVAVGSGFLLSRILAAGRSDPRTSR